MLYIASADKVSPNTQAILLVTAHFSAARSGAAKPLTPKEWGRLAWWLKERGLKPEQLLTARPGELLEGWLDRTVTIGRLEELLGRGAALALAMEKWLRAGLWVMTRSAADYPARLKRQLRHESPPVLFGCGERSLLQAGGLSVVGSRHAAEPDLSYSRELGALAARNGQAVISGGAKGVDEAAMLGALAAGGTAVGVLANQLLRNCSSLKYRKYLMAGKLALVSPCHPEAGFSVANAMQRNKYIYCLSDAAMVVHAGPKGGTWSGATENASKGWVPLWVKKTRDPDAGNAAIVQAGGAWAPERVDEVDVAALCAGSL